MFFDVTSDTPTLSGRSWKKVVIMFKHSGCLGFVDSLRSFQGPGIGKGIW